MTIITLKQLINEIGEMRPITAGMIVEITGCSYETAALWIKRWPGNITDGYHIIGWKYKNKCYCMIMPPAVKLKMHRKGNIVWSVE